MVGPLLPVCLGGEEVQRAVGPVGVVLAAPVLYQHLHFEHAGELLGGEELVPAAAVERLAGAVLPRRGRVDERGGRHR